MIEKNLPTHDPVEGKVVYFLILITLIQTLYPASINNSPVVLIVYQFSYILMIIAGIYLARGNRVYVILLISTSVLWVIAGATYAYRPHLQWANFFSYGVIGLYQGLIAYILVKYIFSTQTVTRDVLYAACAVYLLLGALFVPVYGTIETLTWFPDFEQHAFVDGVNPPPDNQPIPWQTFVYFSYATLTTLGYGDVLPATYWARSVATFEAIVGVLYLTIIMARLVGLYASKEPET